MLRSAMTEDSGAHKQLLEMNVTCVANYDSKGLSRRFKEMEQKGGQ